MSTVMYKEAMAALERLKICTRKVAKILNDRNSEKSDMIKAGTRGAFTSRLLNHMPENQKNAERVSINQMVVNKDYRWL